MASVPVGCFAGARVVVLGLGRSGIAAAEALGFLNQNPMSR